MSEAAVIVKAPNGGAPAGLSDEAGSMNPKALNEIVPQRAVQPKSDFVEVRVNREELDMLRRLHAAGVVHLENALVVDAAVDPRLTKWTGEDVCQKLLSGVRNGRRRKRYAVNTVEKALANLRLVENHACPVQLRPPSEESWLRHVDYVTTTERKPESVLEGRRKAIRLLIVEVLGQPQWPSLTGGFEQPSKIREIPTRATAQQLWTTKESRKLAHYRFSDANMRHFLFVNFNTGIRPPSETCTLRLKDFRWDSFNGEDVHRAALDGDEKEVQRLWDRATLQVCNVTVRQPKKRWKALPRTFDPTVAAARDAPSILNYIVNWRANIARRTNRSPEEWLITWNGKPYTAWNAFGEKVAKACRTEWQPYTNYSSRHFYAVEKLASTFLDTLERTGVGVFDVYAVARDLGDSVKTVEKYYLRAAGDRVTQVGGTGIATSMRTRREK